MAKQIRLLIRLQEGLHAYAVRVSSPGVGLGFEGASSGAAGGTPSSALSSPRFSQHLGQRRRMPM